MDGLRRHWTELLDMADEVHVSLLRKRRGVFEQELDKQVKVGGQYLMMVMSM